MIERPDAMTHRSLAKHTADGGRLQHGREVHAGRLPESFVGSYFPFFFTREGANLFLNGMYRGGAAFLIAGGPSFREVPREPLRRVWAMTLNNAFASYRAQANCTVDDPSRFGMSMWLDPTIQKFVPMGQFEKPLWDNRMHVADGSPIQRWEKSTVRVGDCPNVVGYRRNEKFHAGRWLHEETVNWGNHKDYGGGRSVLLAGLRILFILGFRRVYLLGVDFDMSPERNYHFNQSRTPASIRGNNATYAKLQQWLGELQPRFLKDGFVVKNCNLESKLTAFPFMPFLEAIEEATGELGDFQRERTDGMYASMEEKEKPADAGSAPENSQTPTPAADAI